MAVTSRPLGSPAGSGRPRSRWTLNSSRMSEQTYAYLLILPVVAILLLIMVYPTVYSLWMSLNYIDIQAGGDWEYIGLQNYIYALTHVDIQWSIIRTLLYTTYVTVFATVLAIGGALLLNEPFKGRQWLAALVILPWSVSTYAAAAIFRYMYNPQYGLFDSVLMYLGIVNQNTAIQFIDEHFV